MSTQYPVRATRPSLKSFLMASVAALAASSSAALAQQASGDEIETVVVNG